MCTPLRTLPSRHNLLHAIREKQSKQADQISHSSECICIQIRPGTEKRPPEQLPAAFGPSLPTVDNLRNFFLTPTKEMLRFLAAVDISLKCKPHDCGLRLRLNRSARGPFCRRLPVAALLDFSATRASACTLLYTAGINLAADKVRRIALLESLEASLAASRLWASRRSQ